ncbi:efflux RND transporter periplasmic adaptor subunit [Aquabacterium sp.]|uniref:efflux RND transporter periplasmic adaptor subunit n=1 Tax=Aquabacterium sp. TaxID=1872578 RepID=UPI002E36C851|nr:HlyD family efflux transporter periplasmic adaptor subunit [Aquabacterium sp.]HEX5312386.1 HlyD family efflux transporter periplasmic adaptor subunit [Aquabacterium sp.]
MRSKLMILVALSGCLALAGSVWAGPGAHGPNGEHLDATASVGAPAGLHRLPDGHVQVPKLAQRRMQVRTVVAETGTYPTTMVLNARVVMDPASGGVVQAAMAGRMEAAAGGLPVAGQAVRKGQVLAYIQPAMGGAERGSQRAALAEVRASRLQAEARVNRLKQLEGVVPRKESEAAQWELQGLREREAALAQSLEGRQAVLSSTDGVLASARVLHGQMVEPQAVLFEIVDPKRMLIEARVSDPAWASQIRAASVQQAPDLALKLVGVARVMQEGAVPVTFRASTKANGDPAASSPLAIGQPLTLVAELGQRQEGVALPSEAVVRSPANEPIVWVKVSAERFAPQPVQAQPLDAQRVLVTRGLSANSRVVVQGASLINQIR